MEWISIIGIIISVIALMISALAYWLNVSKHNLQQLQTRYQIFCDKFQSLLMYGSQHQLTDFKFELNNICILDPKNLECDIAFNNLQKSIGTNKDACKKAYNELCDNLDFWETKSALKIKRKENDFVTWLNNTINSYYAKLSHFYIDLFDINFFTKIAQLGVLDPNAFDRIKDFYQNIKDIAVMHETLLALKREITGTFCRLSVRDIGFFNDNINAIKKIEKYLMTWIHQFGIKEVIENNNFRKISTVYKDFNESSFSYINEEEKELIIFINGLIEMSQKTHEFKTKKCSI